MNRLEKIRILISAISMVLLSGCVSVESRRNVAISHDLHFAHVAIEQNREDIAYSYIKDAQKLVPTDKHNVIVKPFSTVNKSTGKITKYIVVPSTAYPAPSVVVDSSSYNSILAQNPTLQSQVNSDNKQIDNNNIKTEKLQQDIKDEASKTKKSSWFNISGVIHRVNITFGVGIIGSIIILIVAAVFFPEILPIVINIISAIWLLVYHVLYGIISEIFKYANILLTNFGNWIKLKLNKGSPPTSPKT